MTNQKPIEPLPSREFVTEMWHAVFRNESSENTALQTFAAVVAQWGFNQHAALNEAELQKARDEELEACYEWLCTECYATTAARLRAARRPKPPSLKEQALQALANADGADYPVVATVLTADQHALIREALEQLDD